MGTRHLNQGETFFCGFWVFIQNDGKWWDKPVWLAGFSLLLYLLCVLLSGEMVNGFIQIPGWVMLNEDG